MGKGKRLNEVEITQINLLSRLGYSNRHIAREIGRSEGVIRNFYKKSQNYGIKKRTKGNSKLTARQKGQIRHEATKNRLNSSQIIAKLNLPVVKSTVTRVLNSSKTIKWMKLKGKPRLTKINKMNRLKFAEKYMNWTDQWKKVIFSDEKKFNLDGPDCYSNYWHDLRNHDVTRSKRNFGGGTVMVWSAFSYDFKLPICWITTRMNSNMYCDLLEDVLISHLEENVEGEFMFQQDNASIHVSRKSKEWFSDKDIPLLDWPACSPDLNPIENLWGLLASKVYENGRQFATTNELKQCIRECWEAIGPEILHNLINSMPKRIFHVIKNKGSSTKY